MNKLRELRKAKGLTQVQLAELAGCSRSYISAIERGETKLSMYMAELLAPALGVEPFDILGGDAIRYRGSFFETQEALLDAYFDSIVGKAQIKEPELEIEWKKYWIIFNITNTAFTPEEIDAIYQLVDVLSAKHREK